MFFDLAQMNTRTILDIGMQDALVCCYELYTRPETYATW